MIRTPDLKRNDQLDQIDPQLIAAVEASKANRDYERMIKRPTVMKRLRPLLAYLYAEGVSPTYIATRFRFNVRTTRARLQQWGGVERREREKELVDQAIALWKEEA